MVEENTPADRLPNEPARVKVDHAQGRVRLTYAGQTIVSLGVRVRRDGEIVDAKSAGVRLIAVSKHTGWDRIVQTIRISGVATRAGDALVIRGLVGVPEADDRPAVGIRLDGDRMCLDALKCVLEFTPSVALVDSATVPAAFETETPGLRIVFRPNAAGSLPV